MKLPDVGCDKIASRNSVRQADESVRRVGYDIVIQEVLCSLDISITRYRQLYQICRMITGIMASERFVSIYN